VGLACGVAGVVVCEGVAIHDILSCACREDNTIAADALRAILLSVAIADKIAV
jgi:hypothetical protein